MAGTMSPSDSQCGEHSRDPRGLGQAQLTPVTLGPSASPDLAPETGEGSSGQLGPRVQQNERHIRDTQ